MTRPKFWLTALAAVVIGCLQPMAAAQAGFLSTSASGSTVGTHTLATPVLSCNPGGLLVTTVTLTWPQVSSAATTDPYGTYLADGYEVHRATGSGPFSLLALRSRTDTSYVDTPGGTLTTYRYKLRTTKHGWVSPFSNEVTASVTKVLVGLSTTCSA